MFVKGGSLLPLLIMPSRTTGKNAKTTKGGVKSLLQVYPLMEVTLQLFLDAGGMAEGLLYWDDGLTMNHSQESEKALVLFRLDEQGLLTVTRMMDHSRAQYDNAVTLKQVELYGQGKIAKEKPVVKDMTRYMGNETTLEIDDITVLAWEGGGEAEAEWSNFKVTLEPISI